MLTFPAERKQGDGKGDQYSAATARDFTGTIDLTRQEDEPDSNINNILKRFGVTGHLPNARNVQWGAILDESLDLQTALNSVRAVQEGYKNLPADLRKEYPTWQSLWQGILKGEITSPVNDPAEDADSTTATGNKDSADDAGKT